MLLLIEGQFVSHDTIISGAALTGERFLQHVMPVTLPKLKQFADGEGSLFVDPRRLLLPFPALRERFVACAGILIERYTGIVPKEGNGERKKFAILPSVFHLLTNSSAEGVVVSLAILLVEDAVLGTGLQADAAKELIAIFALIAVLGIAATPAVTTKSDIESSDT